jgi:hypothetical protein
LEDVGGDLKDATEMETAMTVPGHTITVEKCLTVVEYMKAKGAKDRNGVRNKRDEVKQELCIAIRGYN